MGYQKPGYNEAKTLTLSICRELGEVSPRDLAGVEEITAETASMRLIRYHKQGLLTRTKEGRSYVYTLTQRGLERLQWLETQPDEEYYDLEFSSVILRKCKLIRDQETRAVTDVRENAALFENKNDLMKFLRLIEERKCRVNQ
jgi:hypothetical protein